jgi:hypothetical protein
MNVQSVKGSIQSVNKVLRQLFEGHGVNALLESNRVVFPAHTGLWTDGEIFRSYERICQLDVRFGGFDGKRVLVESIAGFGADINAQAQRALQAYANASFHVLLPAFFDRPPCHGTERETWMIGRPRLVYPGPITTVFGFPPPKVDGNPNLEFYPAFKKRMMTFDLSPQTHWLRIYQMRHNGNVLANEVLVDNEPSEQLQTFMSEQSWPVTEKPYDVRTFLVIKNES